MICILAEPPSEGESSSHKLLSNQGMFLVWKYKCSLAYFPRKGISLIIFQKIVHWPITLFSSSGWVLLLVPPQITYPPTGCTFLRLKWFLKLLCHPWLVLKSFHLKLSPLEGGSNYDWKRRAFLFPFLAIVRHIFMVYFLGA